LYGSRVLKSQRSQEAITISCVYLACNMQSIIAHLLPNQYCSKDGIIILLQQLRSTLVFELIADKDVVQISSWPASC